MKARIIALTIMLASPVAASPGAAQHTGASPSAPPDEARAAADALCAAATAVGAASASVQVATMAGATGDASTHAYALAQAAAYARTARDQVERLPPDETVSSLEVYLSFIELRHQSSVEGGPSTAEELANALIDWQVDASVVEVARAVAADRGSTACD
jgi:hypothetical protein